MSELRQRKDRLDRVYFCKVCSSVFIFSDDMDMHRHETGHNDIVERDIEGNIEP